MRTLLLTNPNAGRVRKIGPTRLVSFLSSLGLDVRLIAAPTAADSLNECRSALRSEEWQRVVVAGGDGSIHSVLPALADAAAEGRGAPPLGILPVGSVNVLARELSIPFDLSLAARVVARGQPRRIDLGLLNDRPFVLMCGIGFDGAAVSGVRREMKARLGAIEYVTSGLRLLLAQPAASLEIECDGVRSQARSWQVVVTNSLSYTYGWTFAPEARIDDGRLDVCVMPEHGRLARLRQVVAILRHRPHAAGVSHLAGCEITITAPEPLPLQMDGDPAPPVAVARFGVIPKALTVMTPKA